MLDRDLAMLYGVKTKALNQAVKRNLERFEGYFFELSEHETSELVTSCDRFSSLKHASTNPYAFNEYGVLMLSSVLKNKTAIDINRKIIKVFVELRKQTIEVSAYELMREKVKVLSSQLEELKTHHIVTEATLSTKTTQLSKELLLLKEDVQRVYGSMEKIENAHIIIERPEAGINGG